jgi:hypothetical protein
MRSTVGPQPSHAEAHAALDRAEREIEVRGDLQMRELSVERRA